MLEATALELGREFVLHVVRQRSTLAGQEFDERRVVLQDNALKERLLGTVSPTGAGAPSRAGVRCHT